MDTLTEDREIIQGILSEHATMLSSSSSRQSELVFDQTRDSYLLIVNGWDGWKRIHAVMAHVDIINAKFWVQRDETEDGIATELLAAGIPKDRIVLAFRPPSVRQHTDFAVA
jgi:hypothetical protein